jgi:hypothetical protein
MTEVSSIVEVVSKRVPWNKGKIVGAKPPLLISGTGWMAGIGHGQTHHSSGPTSALGQKLKSSMRAHVFRFTPESGLKSDIAGGPKRAKGRHFEVAHRLPYF